jgi:DNA polymerase III delta subunit
VHHLGDDVDALLNGIDITAVACGDGQLRAQAVAEVIGGLAERPIWEFTGAVLEGNAKRALELLGAGGGLEPAQAASALHNELRKMIACAETADDGEASAWAGLRGRPNLYHARNRARVLGKPLLVRLLNGVVQAQRQLRQSGYNSEAALEMLVLHAQRVIKGMSGSGGRRSA